MTDSRHVESHANAMFLAKLLGYEINIKGMCNGFSHMAMQAILLDDLPRFLERIKKINVVIEKFKKSFSYDEMTIAYLLILNDTKTFPTEVKKIRVHDPKKFIQQIDPKKLPEIFNEWKEKIGQIIQEENFDINDLRAFFDGVVLYQMPSKFSELFPEKVTGQNIKHVVPLVSPVNLREEKIHRFTPIFQSCNENELENLLNQLAINVLSKSLSPKSLIISGSVASGAGRHAVTVKFDPKKNEWQLINSDRFNVVGMNAQQLAKEIMRVYQHNNYANLAIEVFCFKSEMELLSPPLDKIINEVIEDLKQNPEKFNRMKNLEWMRLLLEHGANPNLSLPKRDSPVHMAIKSRDQAALQLLLAYGGDIDKPGKDGKTPLDLSDNPKHLQASAELYAQDLMLDIKNYIATTPWKVNLKLGLFGGQKITLDDGKEILVPDRVAAQWEQIKLAEAKKIKWRHALRAVYSFALSVEKNVDRAPSTTNYYEFFREKNYDSLRKKLQTSTVVVSSKNVPKK